MKKIISIILILVIGGIGCKSNEPKSDGTKTEQNHTAEAQKNANNQNVITGVVYKVEDLGNDFGGLHIKESDGSETLYMFSKIKFGFDTLKYIDKKIWIKWSEKTFE